MKKLHVNILVYYAKPYYSLGKGVNEMSLRLLLY